ncbi:MAG: DUF2911 domain-containing protein [Cyclobacteriaceae bacterium]
MIKKIFLGVSIIIILFVAYFSAIMANSRIQSPAESVNATMEGVEVTVDYSRPYKKGRKIFGGLVPYGKYWRTGANDATEISFSKDVYFAGQLVKAGKYWLYTIPGEEEWTVVLNTELGAWGLPGPNPTLDVLSLKVTAVSLPQSTEQFKISLEPIKESLDLQMIWDNLQVSVQITLK